MNAYARRRDDRPPADHYKPWPADKYPHDFDPDRRRQRSATVPSLSHDPRSYPSSDPRLNDPRLSSRSHRQDPLYPPAVAPHSSYQRSSAQAPPTSRAYQHATRTSAQHAPSGHHYPQPSYQPSHATPVYPPAGSSRRPHPEPSDPRPSARSAAPPHYSYEQPAAGEEMAKTARHTSRPTHPSVQPSTSAPPNQAIWNPSQEGPSRRHRDRDRDLEREKEREREREKEKDRQTVELENRYKDRARAERHRERERERERPAEARHQEPRSRHHDRRKDSDTEGPLYSEQRNTSRVSLSAKDGHPTTVREPGSAHRRHRTEDGTVSTGRRQQPENMQNPITTVPSQSITAPQPDVQQTGEPPPAPRVMPVYLPQKAKPHRSHREGRPSTAQGAQSGSDTEKATGRHRMERTPSGPAVQRSDTYSSRDRGNHDTSLASRDDPKSTFGAHQDTRQPLAPMNVDIPLVTPGSKASALPAESRPPVVPQIVSIRAGQGPSDPHDTHYKSSAISHSDVPQDIIIHPPLPPSASGVKSSIHARSQSFETRPPLSRPAVVDQSRTEPRADDLPPGQRMSVQPSSARGNPEIGVDNPSSSYLNSRSAHRTSATNAAPPAVAGPRPLRSVSQGQPTNESSTRPPSVAHHVPTAPNQQSGPPSPAHPANGSPSRTGHTHGSLSSAHPSPKNTHLNGVTFTHSTSTQQVSSAASSVHPTPTITPRTVASSSRPSTRDGYIDVPSTHAQSTDRQATVDIRPGPRQTTTVEASWVVQTPANVKKSKIFREEKYLRDHRLDSETPHAQLRQVLSQEDDSFPRASSSMMKASQATTPTSSSQRNSPGTRSRDVSFGTPRGTSVNNSPRSASAKEAPTPKQTLPPQIAIVGATPVTTARDLPQGRVDHALLAPPFTAPSRASRTNSSSQDQHVQPLQPAPRNIPPTSHQPPQTQTIHAPSLFQPYRPPSLPSSEDDGQFSPPPLPIPPPRGLEDSPPPPIETRTSEIIPARSQGSEHLQSYANSIPEVQSEMFHVPSQPSVSAHSSSLLRPLSNLDGNTFQTPISNGLIATAHSEVKYSKFTSAPLDDVPVAHQEIMLSVNVLPSEAAPARTRPKATIEDVPEHSPLSSKPVTSNAPMATPPVLESRQSSHYTTLANTNPTFQHDQHTIKSSPQSKSKDSPLHRGNDPSSMLAAQPMPPPPPSVVPMSTRAPSSAPPVQSTFFPTAQAASAQRATYTTPSRPYQRAAEMLQTSKLSTPIGPNSGTTASVVKSATAPVPTTSTVGGQHQPGNAVGTLAPLPSRPVNLSAAPFPSATPAVPTTKAATQTAMTGSVPPSTSTQLPFTADAIRQQPSRSGPLPTPPDAATTAVMPTTAVRNIHNQEQSTMDSTRARDVPSAARSIPSSSHIYPTPARPNASSATAITQQTHVNSSQPLTHHRVVSLPITTSSSAAQKPPSPRKYSQPIPSTVVSTQPFPSRPPALESQPSRPSQPHVFTPAPGRFARLTPPDRSNDLDMLKTPSSIAPSPMLNSDTSNAVPQSIAVPIRTRQSSTDSKDDKKKPSGLFGIFRARTLSSKAADPPAIPSTTRTSLDQKRVQPDASAVPSNATPAPRGVPSTSAPKEPSSTATPATSGVTYARGQPKFRGRVPDPAVAPLPARVTREQKDTAPHMFTPFKFLSMQSKRNRTVSAASLDVCDGNTATNTVVGSPDHSTLSQAQPLPPIIPPGVRDPLIAASEWRDREEAERKERRTHRIRRPGVTFDLDEEPPSPAPGTASKRKKLVRRVSGRAPTPGPLRG